MTVDTIFDAASLTKVLATTPAVMKLFEQGRIVISNPVTAYLPEFQGGKSGITVRDLMTCISRGCGRMSIWCRRGLVTMPAFAGALADKPDAPPGERFVYSDINFELLGEIVRRVDAGEAAQRIRARNDLRNRWVCARPRFFRPRHGSPASRLRRTIRPPASRFAEWCTIPPLATWAEWPDTRACSPRPTTSRSLRR